MKDFLHEFISIKKFSAKMNASFSRLRILKQHVCLYQTAHNKEPALNYLESKASVLIENIVHARNH